MVVGGKKRDRAAVRAAEGYEKAVAAFQAGERGEAAFYLGAMAHYIGDVSQYGHSVPFEQHHSDYEGWVGRRTEAFDTGHFEDYIVADSLVLRTPCTAVKRISKVTAGGRGDSFWAMKMDAEYADKNDAFVRSVGLALNLGVNELADVLHRFFVGVVDE